MMMIIGGYDSEVGSFDVQHIPFSLPYLTA